MRVRRRREPASPAASLVLLFLFGCRAAAPPPPPAAPPPPLEVDTEAVLLLQVDRKLFDPFTVRRLADGPPGERAALARALGRIGDRRARVQLEIYLSDPDPEVRARAAFALGELGDAAAVPALLTAAAAPDRRAARLAVASLAGLEAPLPRVVAALAGLEEEERWARLSPPLFRFAREEIRPVAVAALAGGAGEARRWVLYALARQAVPESRPELRDLLDDPDPWLRGLGARALGTVGEAEDLERLEPLLEDPAAGPVIQALRAGRTLVAAGRAGASEAWRAGVARRLADPRPGVRLTAVESAGPLLPDPLLGPELVARARAGAGRERELALAALATADHPQARELAGRAAVDPAPAVRAAAAEAAGELGLEELLERLASDREPRVRLAVLAARVAGAEPAAAAAAALRDPDPALRAAALDWLTGEPAVTVARLEAALETPGAARLPVLALNGVRAIAARGRRQPAERERAVELLERLAASADFPVRREAGSQLAALGRSRPAVGTVATGRSLDAYRDLARQSAREPQVELVTRHGAVRIRLLSSVAPLTCVSFLQLAAQGFYDGLAFHRVLPDFVVQGGDPRGDGWGGPGYLLRDENSWLSYTRGTVGMALSGADTGGSQFFITLSHQPHLEGSYPAFGRVVAGDEVLDRIVQGDRIESAREVR